MAMTAFGAKWHLKMRDRNFAMAQKFRSLPHSLNCSLEAG